MFVSLAYASDQSRAMIGVETVVVSFSFSLARISSEPPSSGACRSSSVGGDGSIQYWSEVSVSSGIGKPSKVSSRCKPDESCRERTC